MSYPNPWLFNGLAFDTPDIADAAGFVYLIRDTETGRMYVGRKMFWQLRKKKGKARRVKSESDWKKYWGSSEVLLEDLKRHGKDRFKRSIVSIHSTKGDVNFAEVQELFTRRVLDDLLYYNDNINGKWYRKPAHITSRRRYSTGELALGQSNLGLSRPE